MEVNSAAIPEALLESELFGYERGAFTGADRRRIGKFEQCNGGTLFLDEIGDMSPPLQAKILRVLQEQRFERVGGNDTIATDVRVIAATNRNLEEMVTENQFRDDLFYRLNGFTIRLPSLRERGDDLILLIDHFLAKANHELGKSVRGVSPEIVDILERYTWPGNVRELQSVIRQAVLQSTGPVLFAEFLPETVEPAAEALESPSESASVDYWGTLVEKLLLSECGDLYDQALHHMEKEVISRVLSHVGGNQVAAAKILGITRTTLRTKIRHVGIAIDKVVHKDEEDED
jgi:two-component system nitrogen regulation response regulator GlnG